MSARADSAPAGLHAEAVSPELAEALATLRAELRRHHYDTVYRLHCYEIAPRGLAASLGKTLARAPAPTQDLLRLFYFRKPLEVSRVERVLGHALTHSLERGGILLPAAHDAGLCCRFKLELLGDTLLFTDAGRSVYFGEDSEFLRAMLAPARDELCCDLCTGSGVQALRCAPLAAHVDAVDLDPAAVWLAKVNASLNGLSETIDVYEGDLWEGLPGQAVYDLIVCNPPLVPVPEEVAYPLCGHGGGDGLAVVRRILAGLDAHLSLRGRAALIGACTGDERGPAVAAACEAATARAMQVDLFLLLRVSLRDWVGTLSQTVEALYPRSGAAANTVLRCRRSYGARFDEMFVYTYLLLCARNGGGGGLRTFDYTGLGQRSYWFVGRGRIA